MASYQQSMWGFQSAGSEWCYQQGAGQWTYAPQTSMINAAYFSDDSDSDEESVAPQEGKAGCEAVAPSSEKELKAAPQPEPKDAPMWQQTSEPAAEPLPTAPIADASSSKASTSASSASSEVGDDASPSAAASVSAHRDEGSSASDAGYGGSEPDFELEAPPTSPPERTKSIDEPEAEITPEASAPLHAQMHKRASWSPSTSWGPSSSWGPSPTHSERSLAPAWAPRTLRPSANSWAARQRDPADEDTRVVRSMKSLLNKLTVEKFPQLYDQLLSCGIRTTGHVQALIQEVFQKATTQHHFIDMYADLCSLLNEHFVEQPISEDPKFNFKRLLLNECQSSFERHLTPPEEIKKIDDFDERSIAEHKYKTRMLGTIRFVGALVVRKMLVAKVMLSICAELLSDPTPEALESLAALLAVVGATFDHKDFPGYAQLAAVFNEMEALTTKTTTDSRARCLLQDVLDLRASGWKDQRPKRIEGPMKLTEVAQRAAEEQPAVSRACTWSQGQSWQGGWSQQGGWSPQGHGAWSPQWASRPTTALFDREAFRTMLLELRCSRDEAGAAERLAELPPPPATMQGAELSYMWSEIAQESAPVVRKAAFALAAKLFFKGLTSTGASWESRGLADGVRDFAKNARSELAIDVPALPQIVKQELIPTLKPLKVGGLITESTMGQLLSLTA